MKTKLLVVASMLIVTTEAMFAEHVPVKKVEKLNKDTISNQNTQSNVAVTVEHPEWQFPPDVVGCGDIRSQNLERFRREPRPPVMVPAGCDSLLSQNCPVSSSDDSLSKEDLQLITDGVKSYATNAFVALKDGRQWVQLDLSDEKEIYAVCVWHYLRRINIYRDVICQLSNDPNFTNDVTTIFNNDHNNSSQLGAGPDKEYIEDNKGRLLPADGKKARYVRLYSNGSAARYNNDYIEVEVFGRGTVHK